MAEKTRNLAAIKRSSDLVESYGHFGSRIGRTGVSKSVHQRGEYVMLTRIGHSAPNKTHANKLFINISRYKARLYEMRQVGSVCVFSSKMAALSNLLFF